MSLEVAAGECVALVGPSGAGKSTLGALVARFHDPVEGRVLIDGRDARDCALEWLRGQVAILLQDTVLFTGTVRENIAYGSDASDEAIVDAARAAVAHDFICELPEGYDTELGPQGAGLSGGQRQRIGIARTLLRDPPILLLDEPTTALDAASEAQLLDGLKRLMRGRTTILVSHSPRLTRLAHRVVRIERGRVSERRSVDPALPQLERLLDPEAMAEVLDRSLDSPLGDVRVSRVVYKPGELVAVHYHADVGDAVATCIAGVDLAERARQPRYADRARRINGRSPAPNPLSYDDEVGTLVTWLPFDPRLPALGETAQELARRLGTSADGELELIGYKPRGRAVMRLGPLVLKAYGRERQFEAALAGLEASQDGPLPTAAFAGAVPELRLTAQECIGGHAAGEAADVAGEAGAMAAALQRADLAPAIAYPPEKLLDAAARKAVVVETVLPELGDRLDSLVRRLGAALPAGLPLLPAHGDFHVDQLLVRDDDIAVVDFDQLCVAAPALDLATYAADVVRGRPGDHEKVQAVLEPLLEGYGSRPEALEWHLAAAVLARAAHPFQRQVPGWRERVEATVAVAEASLE